MKGLRRQYGEGASWWSALRTKRDSLASRRIQRQRHKRERQAGKVRDCRDVA